MKKVNLHNYIGFHVSCNNEHPDLTVYIKNYTPVPYLPRSESCPVCEEKAKIKKLGVFDLTFSEKLDGLWKSDVLLHGVLYSLKCKECDNLSFIKPSFQRWKENLKIKTCPVCGSNDFTINKHYVDLKLSKSHG